MESQVFDQKAYSLSPVELIPDDDGLGGSEEVDERLARYARLGRLVDVDDIVEIVCASLKDSTQLRYLIEDSLEDPHPDVTRPRMHVSELIRMGQQVLNAVAIAVNEQVSMLDVVED